MPQFHLKQVEKERQRIVGQLFSKERREKQNLEKGDDSH
jgi:hypothetical protein